MALPTMTRNGDVFVVDIGDDLNMTSVAWVGAMNELLDDVEAHSAAPLTDAAAALCVRFER